MEERSQDSFEIGGRAALVEDAPEVAPGTVIAGKYEVERTIGRGGMGLVLGATSLESGERVAIKVLHATALQNKEAVARFEREALAAGKMSGEYTAKILDVGTLPGSGHAPGAPYIVMEYLEGEDLAGILKRRGPLPIAEAVDYMAQACEALARAHGAGVVHRDLKPGNLFRTTSPPRIMILDFGISKVSAVGRDDGESTLTTTESFLGSPVYMSPEQMAAPKKVDTRTDIWALGVTLYRLLTRKVPFEGDTPMAMCGLILSGLKPKPVRDFRDDCPPGLDQAILRCLGREPADRHQDVAALAEAIAPFGTEIAVAAAHRARQNLAAGAAPATTSGPVLPVPPTHPEVVREAADMPTVAEPTSPIGRSKTPSDGTLATWATTRARARRTSRWVLALLGAAALAMAGIFLSRGVRPATVASGPTETSKPAAPPVPAPVPETSARTGTGTDSLAETVAAVPPAQPAPVPSASFRSAGRLPRPAGSAHASPAPSTTTLPGGVFGGTPF